MCHTLPSVSPRSRTQGPCRNVHFYHFSGFLSHFFGWKLQNAKIGLLRFHLGHYAPIPSRKNLLYFPPAKMPILGPKYVFCEFCILKKISGTATHHQKIKLINFYKFYHFKRLKLSQKNQVLATGCFKKFNLAIFFELEISIFSICYFIGHSLHKLEIV